MALRKSSGSDRFGPDGFRSGSKKKMALKWDEETIAEHDKERGTRQKIDEPPTPFRYSESSDSERGSECDWDTSFNRSPISDPSSSLGIDAQLISPPYPISGPTLSVADNWEALHAKLHYHQQQQEKGQGLGSPRNGFEWGGGLNGNSNDNVMDSSGSQLPGDANVFSFPLRAAAGWSHGGSTTPPRGGGGDIDNSADVNMTTGTSPEGGNGGGAGMSGEGRNGGGHGDSKAFKDKRAAHYNEFKLVQAMRAKMRVEGDDEDDEDDDDI